MFQVLGFVVFRTRVQSDSLLSEDRPMSARTQGRTVECLGFWWFVVKVLCFSYHEKESILSTIYLVGVVP